MSKTRQTANIADEKRVVLKKFFIFSVISFVIFLIVSSSIIITRLSSTYSGFLVEYNTMALELEVQDLKIYLDDRVVVLKDIASQEVITTAVLLADRENLDTISVLNSAKILGQQAELMVFGIDGQQLYETGSLIETSRTKMSEMAMEVLATQAASLVAIEGDGHNSKMIIAVPVIYGAGVEGVLVAEIFLDLAYVFHAGLDMQTSAIKISKDNTTISFGHENIKKPFSQKAVIEPYGVTLELITDRKPVDDDERALLLSYGASILIAAIVSFGLLSVFGYRLLVSPFQKLVQVRHDLDLIFNNVPVRIWYKDDRNKIIRLNRQAAESMGRTVENTEGQNTYDLFPEMAKKYHNDDLKVINSNKPFLGIVEEYTPLEGPQGWVRTDKVPFFDENTGERGVLVVSQDITSEVAAQEELRISENRFSLAVQGSSVGLWDWIDIEGDVQYWSPQLYQHLGYEADELPANIDSFRKLTHPDDLPISVRAIRNHLENKEKYDVEIRMQHKEGHYLWFRSTGQASWDENGEPARMVGSIQNINALKTTENQLRTTLIEQSQISTRLSTIIDTAVDAIVITDTKGNIQTFNMSAQTLFGYEEDAVIDQNVRKLMNDDDFWKKYLESEQTELLIQGQEVYGQRKNGDIFPLELSVGKIEENGEPTGFVAIIRDVTARVRADKILRDYTTALARSNEDLEQFAYIASHDLKAPLRGILNLSDWIKENIQDTADEETLSYLDLLKGRVQRLEQLLAGLLEYSRLDLKDNEFQENNLVELVHNVVDLLNVDTNKISIDVDLPTLWSSETEMSLIFRNLIGNAVKHNADSLTKITISHEQKEDMHIFRVEDNGTGIPEDLQEKVFKMFQTLRPRDEVEGSGMGLAVLKKLITRRGGDIWIESPEEGTGTIFCFSLPEQKQA